jgi:hypothetical protein
VTDPDRVKALVRDSLPSFAVHLGVKMAV